MQDVLNSLQEKLNISCVENFSLVLQNMKSSSHGKMSLLQEHESLAEVIFRTLIKIALFLKTNSLSVKWSPEIANLFKNCLNQTLSP